MRSRLGTILTTVGGALGMLGVIAMAVGLKLTLTPQLQEILFYKGLFAASAVLILLGAIYGRRYRREVASIPAGTGDEQLLGEGGVEHPANFGSRSDVAHERSGKEKDPP